MKAASRFWPKLYIPTCSATTVANSDTCLQFHLFRFASSPEQVLKSEDSKHAIVPLIPWPYRACLQLYRLLVAVSKPATALHSPVQYAAGEIRSTRPLVADIVSSTLLIAGDTFGFTQAVHCLRDIHELILPLEKLFMILTYSLSEVDYGKFDCQA